MSAYLSRSIPSVSLATSALTAAAPASAFIAANTDRHGKTIATLRSTASSNTPRARIAAISAFTTRELLASE